MVWGCRILSAREPAPTPLEPSHLSGVLTIAAGDHAAPTHITEVDTIQLSPFAQHVLRTRYLDPDETPAQMFERVAQYVPAKARGLAYGETTHLAYLDLISSGRFLPNSPTLANAGRSLKQLSACFVLPIEDSLSGIFETAKNMAVIHKSGGGTGFSFGKLRPKGSTVAGIKGVAGGPVAFMRLFNAVSLSVEQGSMRHGANMAILPVEHPDIREFIHCKDDADSANPAESLSAFNISVGVTAPWMERATSNPQSPEAALLQEICESAWKTGDPGIVFLDRMNNPRTNPVPSLGPIEATNPCGEQPLYPFDSCNLGSLNLAAYWTGKTAEDDAHSGYVDWFSLAADIETAVQFLDDVIDANEYPLPKTQEVTQYIRRIGLGVMGLADLLALCHIRYDSEEALDLCHDIASFIQSHAHRASEDLAKDRGPYPAWETHHAPGSNPRRHCAITTIAPTGTISIIAGCSSGIEPHYALEYERNHAADIGSYTERVKPYRLWRDAMERDDRDPNGTPPPWFRTAQDIEPVWHLRMQAVWQKYVDNAVSKTINLPHSATAEDVRKVYEMAYDFGLLGVTVYRDGCRERQVLTHPTSPSPASPGPTPAPDSSWYVPSEFGPEKEPHRHRLPQDRESLTHSFRIGDSKGYIHVSFYPSNPFSDDLHEPRKVAEVFAKIDKAGSSLSALLDSVCMAISLAVQYGVPLQTFIEKYRHSRFEPSGLTNNPKIRTTSSPLDYLARFLEQVTEPNLSRLTPPKVYSDNLEPFPHTSVEALLSSGDRCQCGAALLYQEGCLRCSSCDYSRC